MHFDAGDVHAVRVQEAVARGRERRYTQEHGFPPQQLGILRDMKRGYGGDSTRQIADSTSAGRRQRAGRE